MRCRERLEAYLRERQVPFEVQQHRPAYTAQDVAAAERIPTTLMSKVVIVFADARMVMLVLPASHRVDLAHVGPVIGAQEICLAGEREIAAAFPDCEVGAMPPFGNLYGIPVYIDRLLAQDQYIIFQAGNHSETFSMRYADYARLAEPTVVEFARHFREIVVAI